VNDFAFLAILVAFFALAALFVAGCDRIIGTEEEAFTEASTGAPVDDRTAA
jgi:hypothetical protein